MKQKDLAKLIDRRRLEKPRPQRIITPVPAAKPDPPKSRTLGPWGWLALLAFYGALLAIMAWVL